MEISTKTRAFCIELGAPLVPTSFRAQGATDEQVAFEIGKVHLGIELGYIKPISVSQIDGHLPNNNINCDCWMSGNESRQHCEYCNKDQK